MTWEPKGKDWEPLLKKVTSVHLLNHPNSDIKVMMQK